MTKQSTLQYEINPGNVRREENKIQEVNGLKYNVASDKKFKQ